ncbi:hypothetical protein AC1031_005322 [Aphanomyces cochlioides]|nr:hypothetical protein AC1031_005322 [Aphanomyces cochlioides]
MKMSDDSSSSLGELVRPIPRAQSFGESHDLVHHDASMPRTASLSDLRVRGAIFRRGPIEYNGCGAFLGTTNPGTKKDVRCGNCGDYDHITIDCVLLGDEGENDQPSLTYLQKELHRSHVLREGLDERVSPTTIGRKVVPAAIPERSPLQ